MEIDDLENIKKFSSQSNFLIDFPFLFDMNIYEFDIRQANINMIFADDIIDKSTYEYLSNLPKQLREVQVGLMIKQDPNIGNVIKENINSAKCNFIIENNIPLRNIIRIANDSLYIIDPFILKKNIIEIHKGRYCEFVLKNTFRNYMKLSKNVLLFVNTNGDNWNIDVKGIADSKLPLHEKFLSSICSLIDTRVYGGRAIALREFNNFYNDYINRRLPVEYYREFNSDSMYRLKDYYIMGEELGVFSANNIPIGNINIDCNLNILRNIYSYFMT